MMKLEEYIKNNFDGSQAAFARAEGIKPQQVTQWMNKGFIVINDTLYSPRRALKEQQNDNTRVNQAGIRKNRKDNSYPASNKGR